MQDRIRKHLLDGAALREKIAAEHCAVIERMAEILVEAFKAKKRFFVAGNGGSAADAQHITVPTEVHNEYDVIK